MEDKSGWEHGLGSTGAPAGRAAPEQKKGQQGDTQASSKADACDLVLQARASFPAALLQPEGSFRFSQDALLLADFLAECMEERPKKSAGYNVADLGAGCGVIGFGLMLRHPKHDWRVVGLEREACLCRAAEANAARLGLGEVYSLVEGDIAHAATLLEARRCLLRCLPKGCPRENPSEALLSGPPLFDAVVCNPPWRSGEAGRLPPSPTRRKALFGDKYTYPLFLNAADNILRPRGSVILVGGADRVPDVLAAMPCRLRPVLLRFVHATATGPAQFFLLRADKGSRAVLTVGAPWLLDARV